MVLIKAAEGVMNNQYFTRNFHVSSLIGDFKLFHNYIFDCDLFKKNKKCRFDIINLSNDDKIKMLADCTYEVSMFKNKLKTTNESFKDLEDNDFKDMYINVLEVINVLKPYVLESDLLHEMKIKNYFRAVFDDSVPMSIKQPTKDPVITSLLEYFYNKDKEYETKASFHTAAESKSKIKKHYTEETWFIVGLKFVDGTVYELNKDGKGLGGEDLVRGIFKNEFLNLEETEIKDLFNKYKEYVYYSLNTKGKETHSKNMFKNNSSKLKRWQILFDYFKEKGLLIDNRFHEDYKKNYRVSLY